jgi:hypothetical protein
MTPGLELEDIFRRHGEAFRQTQIQTIVEAGQNTKSKYPAVLGLDRKAWGLKGRHWPIYSA